MLAAAATFTIARTVFSISHFKTLNISSPDAALSISNSFTQDTKSESRKMGCIPIGICKCSKLTDFFAYFRIRTFMCDSASETDCQERKSILPPGQKLKTGKALQTLHQGALPLDPAEISASRPLSSHHRQFMDSIPILHAGHESTTCDSFDGMLHHKRRVCCP